MSSLFENQQSSFAFAHEVDTKKGRFVLTGFMVPEEPDDGLAVFLLLTAPFFQSRWFLVPKESEHPTVYARRADELQKLIIEAQSKGGYPRLTGPQDPYGYYTITLPSDSPKAPEYVLQMRVPQRVLDRAIEIKEAVQKARSPDDKFDYDAQSFLIWLEYWRGWENNCGECRRKLKEALLHDCPSYSR